MKRIALFFDRTYIDAHYCFTELVRHLLKHNYSVDLYYLFSQTNLAPVFWDERVRTFQFPLFRFDRFLFSTYQIFPRDRDYCAVFGTPIKGAWLAYRYARMRNVPFYYLADEIFDPAVKFHTLENWEKDRKKDILSNEKATATIALSEERYRYQKSINNLPDDHKYYIIPNSASGEPSHIKSSYFRDLFNITDEKPIVLFIGTSNWSLARKVIEDTKHFTEKNYHLIFHGRTKGLMENFADNTFIHFSTFPIPSYLLNYVLSSADLGLVLYDKTIIQESKNGSTGGKIATYLINGLPLIIGNLPEFIVYEKNGIAIFWDGASDIDKIINEALPKIQEMRNNISTYYKENLDYTKFFNKFIDDLDKSTTPGS